MTPDPAHDLVRAVARGERPGVALRALCPKHLLHALYLDRVTGAPHCAQCETEAAGMVTFIERRQKPREVRS